MECSERFLLVLDALKSICALEVAFVQMAIACAHPLRQRTTAFVNRQLMRLQSASSQVSYLRAKIGKKQKIKCIYSKAG